ncbi:DprA-like DNA processing chain A [Gordonia phage SpeedDemon]|nr:DprA-like DNA processing chain A [Gordonia phage SpeedDemon]
MTGRPKRILVTGGRDWTDKFVVERALHGVWIESGRPRDAILVEGECPDGGADIIARDIWLGQRFPVEKVPANWKWLGAQAGNVRNQVMVDRGADICLAFPTTKSRGTWDCVRRAREAGIPVRVFHERTAA